MTNQVTTTVLEILDTLIADSGEFLIPNSVAIEGNCDGTHGELLTVIELLNTRTEKTTIYAITRYLKIDNNVEFFFDCENFKKDC